MSEMVDVIITPNIPIPTKVCPQCETKIIGEYESGCICGKCFGPSLQWHCPKEDYIEIHKLNKKDELVETLIFLGDNKFRLKDFYARNNLTWKER